MPTPPRSGGPSRRRPRQLLTRGDRPDSNSFPSCADSGEPAERILSEDLPQDSRGQIQAAGPTPRVLHLVAAGEELPVAIVSGLHRPRRGRGVAVAEGEVGRVEDAVLIPDQEFPGLIAVAAGEIAERAAVSTAKLG